MATTWRGPTRISTRLPATVRENVEIGCQALELMRSEHFATALQAVLDAPDAVGVLRHRLVFIEHLHGPEVQRRGQRILAQRRPTRLRRLAVGRLASGQARFAFAHMPSGRGADEAELTAISWEQHAAVSLIPSNYRSRVVMRRSK